MKIQTLLKNSLIVLVTSCAFCAYGQQKKFTDYTFVELIEACDITYKMPRGFNVTLSFLTTAIFTNMPLKIQQLDLKFDSM